jgi:hypothetical protein
MKDDIIGLSFYTISNDYKRRFSVLYSHFKNDDLGRFPIRKLLEKYREWLENYISDKSRSIEASAPYFTIEHLQEYKRSNYSRLLEALTS